MDFGLTEEQHSIRDQIRRFAQEKLNGSLVERDSKQIFSRELWQACAGMGLTGLPIPPEYGGTGLDPMSTAVALEALGYGCEDSGLVFSICAHLLACVVPIWSFGTDEQKNRYLPGLCNGTLIGANAVTEPNAGSDAFALETQAETDGTGFRVNGTKTFVTNASIADVALVLAVTDPEKGYQGGITALIVQADTLGYSSGQTFEKLGLRTSPIGELVFQNMPLHASAVLGSLGAGPQVFARAMEWERTCLFAAHVGTIERLLDKSVEHARNRKQQGQTISKFQAVSHKIANMKIHLEAARLLTYKAAWNLERSHKVSIDSAIAKTFVSETLVRSALDTIQVFGGYGFLTEYQVERALRDAVGSTIYSGTSEVQRNIIAGWLGL